MRILNGKPIVAVLAPMILLAGCEKDSPTVPNGSGVSARATAGTIDSSAKVSGAPTDVTTAAVSIISLQRGDKVTVTVTSNECSGNPESVNMNGVLSGLVASGSCAGGLVGQTSTFGPGSADGTISFTATHQVFGTGPEGAVSGAYPNYTVGLNDGYGDTDFNDVILSVRVIKEPGELRCEASDHTDIVTRGATVTCTVTGTGVAVTNWTFVGPSYDDPTTFWRVQGPTSGNSWKGPAIASGDVTAEATVNGVPRSEPLTASFSVKRRTGNSWIWGPGTHWQYTKGAIGANPNCFTGDPREPLLYSEGKLLGWTARKSTCDDEILTPSPFASSTSGYSVKQVTTGGPNNGLWYVSAITYQMLMWSTINPAMTSGSSRKWTLVDQGEINLCSTAARKSITQANFYFFNETCKGLDVDALIAGVWLHEGYGSADGNGHQAQLERGAQLEEFELYVNEEAVYGFDQSSIRESVVELAQDVVVGLRPIWLNHNVVRGNWGPSTFWFWIVSPPHFSDLVINDQT